MDEVARVFRTYMDMPEHLITANVLFAAHTHRVIDIGFAAFLHIFAATEEAGKTRLGDIQTEFVADAVPMTLTTEAAMRRLALRFADDSGRAATVIIDEADKTLTDNRVMALLNHSFAPGHHIPLNVEREAGGWDVILVDAFGPKIIIGIGKLADAPLASRTIPISLARRATDRRLPRILESTKQTVFRPIGQRLREWALSIDIPDLAVLPDNYFPEELGDRACDVWLPLFIMADAVGGDWPIKAREAAIAIQGKRKRQRGEVETLLADVADVFQKRGAEHISTEALNYVLTRDEDYEWGNYRSQSGVAFNTIEQARLLRGIGIQAIRSREGNDLNPQRYLYRSQLEEAWQRYGMSPPPPVASA